MKIDLNGRTVETPYMTLFELRDSIFSADCITILNGFQTASDAQLHDGDTVSIIKKGVMPSYQELESMMSARHTPEVHKKVKSARVAVCGLGGLGSNIAVMLARIGVGFMRLIDFDIVEPSNLNRQSYCVKHLGMLKTYALSIQIAEINPFVRVECADVRLDAGNAAEYISDCEYICEAFDSAEAKAMLTELVLNEFPDKKLVCGSGMAGLESSNKIVTRRAAKNLYICGDGESEAGVGNGLMSPRVAICAGHQANMILRLITGTDEP